MATKYDIKGINCEIYRAKNEPEHFHPNVELDFVIEGHIKVFIEGNDYLLEPEQMLLINSNKLHYTYVDSEALICKLTFSYEMLEDMLGEEYIAFWCNSLTKKDIAYEEIRSTIREIILINLNGDKMDAANLMERYGRLLNYFIRNYKINTADKNSAVRVKEGDRIREILDYVNNHYKEPISLANLSDQMFVSVSTLSRLFKKTTGVKFPDYVNQIRMQNAVTDLLSTNKSITEIAVENGFSTPSSFNRVFRDLYNTSPSQYKKNMRNHFLNDDKNLTKEEEAQVRQYLNLNHIADTKVEETETVNIYLDSYQKFHNISTQTVSLGAFYQLTNSSVQKQLTQMADQLKLKYIRLWNVFSPSCMIAAGPSEKKLSFEIVDSVLDFLTDLHLHPFLDMTEHPDCLIKSSRELFYKKEDSMKFQNLKQWSYFFQKFMEHVVFRYGSEEVSQWIFEFGDLPLSATGVAYYKDNVYREVYETAYKIIRKYCPKAKIGGPDWILDGDRLNLAPYFEMWEELDMYPDFYSVFMFPYKNPNKEKDPYFYDKERNMDPDFLKKQIQDFHGQLAELKAPERPLYITEISTILSNRNAMNDHCGRGTNVLRTLNIFQGYVDMVCFWVATDRLSLHYAPPEILHGGSGLMTKDGIAKPSYYALYLSAKLGNKLLSRGNGYIAVQNDENHIYILCYNHKNLVYNYKYEEEKTVNVYNVDLMFENTDGMVMKFMLHGLEAGEDYIIKRHIVNQDYGSVMDEWRRLGFESEMRNNDIEYLKSVCIPRIQMGHRVAEEGQIYLEATLKAHEMQLIHVYK